MKITDAANAVGGRLVGAPISSDAWTGITTDSRTVTAGDLYVALPGARVDGHDFVAGAAAAGAAAALVEREVDAPLPQILVTDSQQALGQLAAAGLRALEAREQGRPVVVAVTGSVGKTTTKDLLAQVLPGVVHAAKGSLNNEIGLPLTVLRTPEAATTLVLEMGADAPGNITYLTQIAPPDIAVVLRVGRAHLEGFGSVEAVARTKSELVTGLRPGGVAVLNADDDRVAAMAALAGDNRVVTFGRYGEADVLARDVVMVDGRARFQLEVGGRTAPVELALVGEHHVTNALAAAAVAVVLEVPLEEIALRLRGAGASSPHRMAVQQLSDGVTLIDDSYNANPDSMHAALKALVTIAAGRRTVAFLGEMRELGETALTEHDALGRLAVRLDVQRLVVVGAGARAIYTGALLEGSFGEEAHVVADVDAALAWWQDHRRPGDVVLVKSSNGAGLYRLADALLAAEAASSNEEGEVTP